MQSSKHSDDYRESPSPPPGHLPHGGNIHHSLSRNSVNSEGEFIPEDGDEVRLSYLIYTGIKMLHIIIIFILQSCDFEFYLKGQINVKCYLVMVGPKTFQKSVPNARFPTCFKAPNHFFKFLPTMYIVYYT